MFSDSTTTAASPATTASAVPVQVFSRSRRDRDRIEIRPYDFKRPERISKDQMRALEMLHETFARSVGVSLSGYLRSIVEVRVATATQMTFSEFTGSLPNPTSFSLIHCPPLEGQICLEVSPQVIYPIIDRLLGGSSKDVLVPERPMTAIESRLLQRILDRCIVALGEAWQGVRRIEFALGETETNPQLVQIVPPNEVVVVIGFDVRLGGRVGRMNLCIPYNAIEPLVDDLSAQSWVVAGQGRDRSGAAERITRHLTGASVELEATLATTTISLAELRNLEVGDLVVTNRPASAPAVLSVEGRPKYLAHLGQFRGNRALRMDRPIGAGERIDLGAP